MILLEQAGALLALLALAIAIWHMVGNGEAQRPGFLDRSPNGSDRPRWRVRSR